MIKKKDILIIMIVLITIILIGLVIVFFDNKIKAMDHPASAVTVGTKNELSLINAHSIAVNTN